MTSPPATPLWIRIPILLLAASSLWHLGSFLKLAHLRLTMPWTMNMIEPQIVYGALRVARGDALYTFLPEARPIAIFNYGILEYYLPGMVARVFSIDDLGSFLLTGRSLSLLGLAVTVGSLWHLGRQRDLAPRYAVWALFPLFWFPYMAEWHTKVAPDLPALGASLAGWVVLGPPGRTPGGAAVWVRRGAALILWTIAFHFKPTILVGPVAFALERLQGAWQAGRGTGDMRRAAAEVAGFAAALAFAAGATAWMINTATGGLWHLHVVGTTAICPVSPRYAWVVFRNLGPYGLAATGVMVIWALLRVRRSRFAAAYLATLLLEAVLMMKLGSNVNYLVGSVALWGLVLAESAPLMNPAAGGGESRPWRAGFAAVAFVLGAGTAADARHALVASREMITPAGGEPQMVRRMIDAAGARQSLCLDPWFALRQGLPVLYFDGFHTHLIDAAGLASVAPEVRRVQERRYSCIVTNFQYLVPDPYQGFPTFPYDLHQAVVNHYVPVTKGDLLVVWLPREGIEHQGK